MNSKCRHWWYEHDNGERCFVCGLVLPPFTVFVRERDFHPSTTLVMIPVVREKPKEQSDE